jgi:putative transposase
MSKFASDRPDKLTDQSTLNSTIAVLEKYFDLSAEGYLCQTRDLWQVLVLAAARRSTVEATCNDLPGAPDSNTVRGYLNDQLTPDQIRTLEQDCNRALASRWPHWLWSQPLEVACDLHDECYYGESDDDDPASWVCRGERRAGTTHFYRCATLFILRPRCRLTLAVTFVHPDEALVAVLQRLFSAVRERGLRLARLYADKGFCSIPVLRYLRRQPHLSVIMAAPIKGKADGRGLRTLCRGRHSYRTTHTFASAENGELTVPVGIVRAYKERRGGNRTATWIAYVLLRVSEPLRQVRERYRGRFGIDTSYRSMEQVRARTTSQNPALRFLLMGLALVLLNVWVALQWTYLRLRGSGPRRVAGHHFTLARMARFLSRAVEAVYGVVSYVDPPHVKSVMY